MGTRADFFVGVGPTAEWIGSTSYDGDRHGWGRGPLAASTEADFRAAVEAMLADPGALTTRPSEGWPWPWDDFRTSDYAYAWDPERGPVASSGRAWVTPSQMEADSDCIFTGERLRDDEVPDMNHAERCNPVQGAMASELAAAVPEVRSTKLGYGAGHIVFNPIDPGDGFTINFDVAPKRRGRPYSFRDLHLLDQLSLEEAAELVRALVQWRTRMLAARKS